MKSFLQLLIILVCLAGGNHPTSAQEAFIKIFDAKGKQIRGNSVTRFYENQVIAYHFNGPKAKDPVVQFTMDVQTASGILQGLEQNGDKLSSAIVTFTKVEGQGHTVQYTIRLEDIEIISCDNINDTNGNHTLVILRPSRAGTTYYSFNRKTGVNTVTSKSGYDYTTGKAWTNF